MLMYAYVAVKVLTCRHEKRPYSRLKTSLSMCIYCFILLFYDYFII